MPMIEGFRVRNFGVLKDVTLGRLWDQRKEEALTPMTAVIGKNGVGKSVLFDAFGFLADALKFDVEAACDERGGFEKIRTQGAIGPIEFNVYYREQGNARPITYQVVIATDNLGRPFVQQERLRQRRKNQKYGQPFSFLTLVNGSGVAWKGNLDGYQINDLKTLLESREAEESTEIDIQEEQQVENKNEDSIRQINLDLQVALDSIKAEESSETETIELDDPQKLGIATLGALKQHPRISAFRRFIEGWYLSYFTPDAARSLPLAGPQEHLNIHGDNLGNVVQFMERQHPQRFKVILKKIADKIPGINQIAPEKTIDGRVLLKFNDKSFQDPFYAQQMSDGTLKVFAYLLLLEDPNPHPFICIEEPENGLYHKLLETLATEFREHATGHKGGSQVFITTHQPYFVDALNPKEVWILEKGEDGFSEIHRSSEDSLVSDLVKEGLPLGGLWYSDYFDPR
ncbi:MAG: AAA family ATPase [Candidatus Poribacteria bacterium]|nr:AAA family ATPase [Candidatus Poribacteria bacterium]